MDVNNVKVIVKSVANDPSALRRAQIWLLKRIWERKGGEQSGSGEHIAKTSEARDIEPTVTAVLR